MSEDSILSVKPREREQLFQETAGTKGLSALMVEKDFWVCWTLRRLLSMLYE